MMPDASILDRLTCARFIFYSGVETLSRGGPFSGGLAILAFHDAVELALRAIAAHLHAPKVTENMQFAALLDAIDAVGPTTVPSRTQLLQLNRIRVTFKHAALLPRDDDVSRIRVEMEVFLSTATSLFLNLDFGDLSLAGMVKHRRTSNWLRKAEAKLRDQHVGEAVEAAATALAIFMNSRALDRADGHSPIASRVKAETSRRNTRLGGGESDRVSETIASTIDEENRRIWRRLNLIATGINLVDYRRFVDLTPVIRLSRALTIWPLQTQDYDALSLEDARFCVSFAIRSALMIQEQYKPRARTAYKVAQRFSVIAPGPVIVWPQKDPTANETIFEARFGDVLEAPAARSNLGEAYTAVFVDGEIGYIRAELITVISDVSRG